MWSIVLAAMVSAPAAGQAPAFSRQARAVVRIVAPARIRLGQYGTDPDDLKVPATKSQFHDADGTVRSARLVEFS